MHAQTPLVKVVCCKARNCWHRLRLDEMQTAVEDNAFFKGGGYQFYLSYARALYLMSLPALSSDLTRHCVPSTVEEHQHPANPVCIRRRIFVALLGMSLKHSTGVFLNL